MIRLHRLSLRGSLRLDEDAQPLHAEGVGILVNDLPMIPFESRWQAVLRRTP